MKLRPIQLVCLALLLATLRLADPAALPPSEFAFQAGYLNALLSSDHRDSAVSPTRVQRIPAPALITTREPKNLSASSRILIATPRPMRQPLANATAIASHTSFLRAW